MTAPLRDCSNNYVLSYHLKGENLQQLRFVGKLLRRYDRYKVGTFWPLFDVVNLQVAPSVAKSRNKFNAW